MRGTNGEDGDYHGGGAREVYETLTEGGYREF